MSLGAQAWLMLLALALYLYDATLLLDSDEFVAVRSGTGRWTCRFGANGWKLGGREPWVPNLLMPWRATVRVRWSFEEAWPGTGVPQDQAPIQQAGRLTAPPTPVSAWTGVCTLTLLALVFVALPLCLFVYPALWLTACVAGLIYGLAILTMALLYTQRGALGLEREPFWKLCVECVACPPFAINAIRKVTLDRKTPARAADVVRWITDEAEVREMQRQMAVRVREQMDYETEGSERMSRLAAVARRLEAQTPGQTGETTS